MSSQARKIDKNLKKQQAKAYADIASRLVVVGFNDKEEPLCVYLKGKLENTFNVYCFGEEDRTVSDLRYPLPQYKYVNPETPLAPLLNAVPNKKAFANLCHTCPISDIVEVLPEGIDRKAENEKYASNLKQLEEAAQKDEPSETEEK